MPTEALRRHRHADPPFAIDLPADAEVGAAPGVLLAARDPADAAGSPFRPTLTVAVEAVPPGLDTDAYVSGGLEQLAATLPDWRLVDLAEARLGDLPARRVLGLYIVDPGSGIGLARSVSVTLEQWRLVHAGLGWTVSCSCDTFDYARAAAGWTACAESLRPGSGER
jgi:hypothetical protein